MTSAFCAEVVGFFIYGGFFMLTSLGLIFLFGLIFSALTGALKLPKIIGMLITGIILGPYVLNLLSEPILEISGELRTMALVIILIKAGLSLNIGDLKKVGRPALLLSFVPAAFEICAYTLLAPYLLGVTKIQAALTGAVLSAVSPAVVVPRMVSLIENRAGTQKGIPQMLLAGASLDDVFVIVVFSVFLTAEQGGHVDYSSFADIPVSIITGIAAGGVCGVLLSALFEAFYRHGRLIKNSVKVIIVLGLSCGKTVLSVAVLGIIITAPLGAFAMDLGAPALPEKEEALPDIKSQS